MPIGYLITTSLVACGVLGALVPLRRPFILGAVSFVAGFALNELPFIAAGWLVASTLLALDQTGLGSAAGIAAVAVMAFAMAGLLLVVRRALQTGPALKRALALGLGAGWRGSAGDAQIPRRIISGRVVLAPFLMRRRDVTRIANLRYGEAARKTCSMSTTGVPERRTNPSSSTCTAERSSWDGRTASRFRCFTGWPAGAGCASARTTGCAPP